MLLTAEYDLDGVASNGDEVTETLTNDPANGLLNGTTLGVVTDSYDYLAGQASGFGEMLEYTASANASEVFKTVKVKGASPLLTIG